MSFTSMKRQSPSLKRLGQIYCLKLMTVMIGVTLAACATTGGSQMGFPTSDVSGRDYVDTRFGQVHLRLDAPETSERAHNAVVLLHLSPNSGQVFSDVLPLLGEDRIALAPDYPGYGMSDPIPGEQRIEDYARAMLDVIDNAGLDPDQKVDLVGYHTGAAVALDMARQAPDRVGRIALVAIPTLTEEERAAGAALPQIPFDLEGDWAKEEWRRSWKWRGPGQSVESVFATYSEKMRPGARDRGASAVLAHDIYPNLKSVTHPILLVRVKDDLWTASERAKHVRPDADYIELPDYGHGIFHVAPEEMAQRLTQFFDSEPDSNES